MKIPLLLFLLTFTLLANVIIDERYTVSNSFQMMYFEDEDSNLTIGQVQKIPFTKEINNRFTLGHFQPTLWIKFTLENRTNQDKTLYITFDEAFFEKVTLYYKNKNTYVQKKNGLQTSMQKRDVYNHHAHFKVTLKKDESQLYYMQLKSHFATFGGVAIHSEKHYKINFQKEVMYYLLYFGAIGALSLYNLFLYFSLRKKEYLFYVGYSVSFALWIGLYSGIILYFIPVSLYHNLYFVTPLAMAFFILFSSELLNIEKHFPKTSLFMSFNVIALLILSILVNFSVNPWYFIINIIANYIFIIYFILSFILSLQHNSIAKYYIFALTFLLATLSIMSGIMNGLIANFTDIKYFILIGSFIELILFSSLVSFRITRIQKEYESNLKTEIELQTQHAHETNVKLLKSLQEREWLLKEVYHRVKNNFQIIISILWIENVADNNKNEKFTQSITNRLTAMSSVHEMLYSSKNLDKIFLDAYLEKIMLSISQSFTDYKTSIHTNIEKIATDMDTAITLGLIINELIANSMKHAFLDSSNAIITLDIKKSSTIVTLLYTDNGQGFEEEQKKGLGHTLLNDFVSKLKNSSLTVTQNGIHNQIIFTL
ncbi:hypothetical protein JHD48_05240 [Sulfurimonas sp. SAG-AH-194-I05]|nr:7TM diverse intracellular signaling domain-containing protein [Sulfurimonas sp. SAG-AH-194-I05]MDF1875131.1 hypothetical protein [Sulfurimonas sp. SAG-AH-194-I05]